MMPDPPRKPKPERETPPAPEPKPRREPPEDFPNDPGTPLFA